jgi:uncharacterized membrane protein
VSDARAWIALLALVSFLAGAASGFLVASRPGSAGRTGEAFEDYERAFVARFELAPERARLFREVLRNYHRDLEDVRQRALADSRSEMEPRLIELSLRYRDVIRDHVLPESSRADFDRTVAIWTPVP